MSERVLVERQQLYEEVWAKPVLVVARRYGISDVGLAKTCRRMGIPLPPRGYWAKVRAGKHPRRARLLKRRKGEDECAIFWPRSTSECHEQMSPLDQAVPVEITEPIVVGDRLENPHPLVERTARHLWKARSLPAARKGCLDMLVSEASLERALRIMDALLKAMALADLAVEVKTLAPEPTPESQRYYGYRQPEPKPPRQVTRVRCDGEWIEFGISEKMRRVEDPKPDLPKRRGWDGSYYPAYQPTTYSHVPTGVLTLSLKNVDRLNVRSTWSDAKVQRIEDCLARFVSGLSRVTLAMQLKRADDERKRVAAAEAAVRYEQEQARRREDQRRQAALLTDLENWRLARDIREYVAQAQSVVQRVDRTSVGGVRLRWPLKWAEAYADRVDPLSRLRGQVREIEAEGEGQD